MQDAVGLQGRGLNKVADSIYCKNLLTLVVAGAGWGLALCNRLTAPGLNRASLFLSKLACVAYDDLQHQQPLKTSEKEDIPFPQYQLMRYIGIYGDICRTSWWRICLY
jgi:hypothetical protein